MDIDRQVERSAPRLGLRPGPLRRQAPGGVAGALVGLQAAAGNRAVASLLDRARPVPFPPLYAALSLPGPSTAPDAPAVQRRFANAAAVPPAIGGWAGGAIDPSHGQLYANEVVAAAIEAGAPIFTQAPANPREPRRYLVPVLASTGPDVPPSAFWARFDGVQGAGYLALDAVTRAWAYDSIASTEGGTMDPVPQAKRANVDRLIANFTIASVTRREAATTTDAVGRLPGERSNRPSNRIDRQGPAFGGEAARFAVQIGSATYAGIHMPVEIEFPIEVVRAAFSASIGGRYRLLRQT